MADKTTNDSTDPNVIARTAIRADSRNKLRKLAPEIVRQETADLRVDIKIIKHIQGQQGMTRRGVLLEDLEHRFMGTTELHQQVRYSNLVSRG